MSGYQGGDLFSSIGLGGGSALRSGFGARNRPPLGGGLPLDPAAIIPQRTGSVVGKRSLSELQHQQQQAFFLRSVKQRTLQNSPISPLSPVSPEISTASSTSGLRSYNYPILPLQASLMRTPEISFSGIGNRQSSETENDSAEKMKSRLQELERQLLDDDESHVDGSAVSTITNSEWSDAMQSLIVPTTQNKSLTINSPTPSSSCSSHSCPSISGTAPLSVKQQLLDAATAISEGSLESASMILVRLKGVTANTRGGNSEQRLVAHLVQALLFRLGASDTTCQVDDIISDEQLVSTQLLYEASPCFKLGFQAANIIILEATKDQKKIHILDFEIGQGSHYAWFIPALAERPEKPSVKITAVNDYPEVVSSDSVVSAGERLVKLAERVGMSLKFNVVSRKITEISRGTIGCEEDEALAVSLAFHVFKVPDESVSTANLRDELLRQVKSLNPKVVALVEPEMSANTSTFLSRFKEAQSYYSALFESLDATMSREWVRIEECLGRKVMNALAREGRDRVERCEVFGKWRARMGMAGFQAQALPSNLAELVRGRLAAWSNPGFFIKEDAGGLCFGWNGRVLTVASTWR